MAKSLPEYPTKMIFSSLGWITISKASFSAAVPNVVVVLPAVPKVETKAPFCVLT